MIAWVPVELMSFNANVFNSDIELSWLTASELNNSGFEIQRSDDNSLPGGERKGWVSINFIPGFGTTTETQHYSFIDKNLSPGKYIYRLKQIDFDGSYEYSSVVEAEIVLPNKFVLEQNYPNPFNPVTKIRYQIPKVGVSLIKPVQLIIYDILGNEVATLVNEEKQPGVYEVDFNASKLSSGIYFYELKSEGFRSVKKMALMK